DNYFSVLELRLLIVRVRAFHPKLLKDRHPLFASWSLPYFRGDPWPNCRGSALIVNDIGDFPAISQRNRYHVMEAYPRFFRYFDRPAQIDVRLNEDAINAESPRFVAGNRIRHLVRGPALDSWVTGIACLIGRIVRNLGLIKISSAAVPVPKHLELLMVLDKQTINCNAIPVHHESVVTGVSAPADTFPVVRPPNPGVVEDDIITIDP